MIFAAGRGTRLGEITENIPKALIEINGKSALQIAVEKITSYGFDDIIVNIHHHPDKMKEEIEKIKKMGFKLTISDESEQLLETGGGLFKARWFFDDKPFLLYNVDVITDLNLKALYSFHLRKKGIATLAVRNADDSRVFISSSEGVIVGWKNRETGEEIMVSTCRNPHEIAFMGIHVASPAIFNFMKEGIYSMTSLYLELAKHQKIYCFSGDNSFFFDIGTPENLKNARKFFS